MLGVMTDSATTYGQIWRALQLTARSEKVRPTVVLVTVAVAEGVDDSLSLRRALCLHEGAARRALTGAYKAKLIEGNAVDGGDLRPGVPRSLSLTPRGSEVTAKFRLALDEARKAAAILPSAARDQGEL